jgi:hypothetical protein
MKTGMLDEDSGELNFSIMRSLLDRYTLIEPDLLVKVTQIAYDCFTGSMKNIYNLKYYYMQMTNYVQGKFSIMGDVKL